MRRLLVSSLLSFVLASPAWSISITPAAFGSGAIVESFEGIKSGSNVGPSPFSNILEPGTQGAYTFASGVTLSAPAPNPGTMNNGVFIQDFVLGTGASNNWGANGSVAAATNVPFGTAYLGAFDNLTNDTSPVSFTLTFAADELRVGAYVTGIPGTSVRLDVYDASNHLLESDSVATVPVAQWKTNFVGIQRSEGIRRVVFTAIDFGVDGLTFEPSPVPESSSAILLSSGLVGLAVMGRRRGRTPPPARAV